MKLYERSEGRGKFIAKEVLSRPEKPSEFLGHDMVLPYVESMLSEVESQKRPQESLSVFALLAILVPEERSQILSRAKSIKPRHSLESIEPGDWDYHAFPFVLQEYPEILQAVSGRKDFSLQRFKQDTRVDQLPGALIQARLLYPSQGPWVIHPTFQRRQEAALSVMANNPGWRAELVAGIASLIHPELREKYQSFFSKSLREGVYKHQLEAREGTPLERIERILGLEILFGETIQGLDQTGHLIRSFRTKLSRPTPLPERLIA